MSNFPPPGGGPPPPGDSGDSGDRGDSGASTDAAAAGQAPRPFAPPSEVSPPAPQTAGGAATPQSAPVAAAGDKPTVPLRPLGLGDMFDGAFRTIRQNPGATIGVAFLVNLVFLLVPALGLGALALLGELGPLVPDVSSLDSGQTQPMGATTVISAGLSAVASLLASIVVTGLVVQVVARAAIGQKVGAGEAWRRTRPRLLPLLGLTLLSTLIPVVVLGLVVLIAVLVGLGAGTGVGIAVGVLLGIAALVGIVWFFTRYFLLAPCVLVLERSGVIASARRARRLTLGSFWRLLGTYALISVLAYVVASIVAIPLSLLGLGSLFLVGDQTLGTVLVLTFDNLGSVISGALATPFVGAVVALQYLDVRIRREGLDVRLRQQSAGGDGRTGAGQGS